LANNQETRYKVAAKRNAAEQHQAVCQFLNEAGMRDRLLSGLTDSLELKLLKKLLESRKAIELEDFSEEEIVSPSAVSGAAKRLNSYLADFFRKVKLLAGNHVAVTIPRRVGGLQLGYYLACLDTNRKEYLDGVETTRRLLRAPIVQAGVEGFRYLRPIEDVLEVGIEQEPKWFRKKGPVAVDFDDNRVYRREDRLRELKTLVMNNPVSMLEGIAATGKTVLILTLAYDLHNAGEGPVYYFDCDKKRDFDESILIRELKGTEGIFILENVHLAPQKFQSVYSTFKNSDRSHVLFTSRPSFRDYQCSRGEDLTKIPMLTLESLKSTEALIRDFQSNAKLPKFSTEVLEKIGEVSEGNLWLLSYALEGCATSGGIGEPDGWIGKGVREDLNDLKNANRSFPEVLVAVSLLYRNEVPTAESFLRGPLAFDYETFDELVKRGELIVQETAQGDILYGLPHSALAEAYWEYGEEYRRRKGLSKQEELVYSYTVSDVPNGVEAIVKSGYDVMKLVLEKLEHEGLLGCVISKEKSTEAVVHLLRILSRRALAKKSVRASLEKRVLESDNPYDSIRCIVAVYATDCRVGEHLWSILDKGNMLSWLMDRAPTCFLAYVVSELHSADRHLAVELCNLISLDDVAQRLEDEEDLFSIGNCIYSLSAVDKDLGQRVWNLLDLERLACKLSEASSSSDIAHFLWDCLVSNVGVANESWLREQVHMLGKRLNEAENISEIRDSLHSITSASKELGVELLRLLDIRLLAAKVDRSDDIECVNELIDSVHDIQKGVARRLCQMLDFEQLAKRLDQSEDVKEIGMCLLKVFQLARKERKMLWNMLDWKKLAVKLGQPQHYPSTVACIAYLSFVDRKMARELCSFWDLDQVASNLNQVSDLDDIDVFLYEVDFVDRSIGTKLRDILGKPHLRGQHH